MYLQLSPDGTFSYAHIRKHIRVIVSKKYYIAPFFSFIIQSKFAEKRGTVLRYIKYIQQLRASGEPHVGLEAKQS